MTRLYPSLVFPDTDIFTYRQFPLLLFGSPVYFLQPVEPDSTGREDGRELFISSGLCQAHNPAPLQEDRQRFVHLINDIRNRKDDYAAQLSALTVAAMSSRSQGSGGEERHQIISAMLGNMPSPISPNSSRLDLWQARLVLAISEILIKEEEELREELQLLDAQEMEMFKSLQGDSGQEGTDPFDEIERITARLERGRPRELKMRFGSWMTLMKAAPVPEVALFLASSTDSGDQLIDLYEKKEKGAVRPILELNLPERIEAGPTHVITQVQRFHDESREARQRICADLDALVNKKHLAEDSSKNLLPVGPDSLGRWNDLVENHFPASSHGKSSLLFYLLPNCPLADLLGLESTAAAARPVHGLFAVLKRPD